MTVKELRDQLKSYPDSMEVILTYETPEDLCEGIDSDNHTEGYEPKGVAEGYKFNCSNDIFIYYTNTTDERTEDSLLRISELERECNQKLSELESDLSSILKDSDLSDLEKSDKVVKVHSYIESIRKDLSNLESERNNLSKFTNTSKKVVTIY